MTPLTRRTALMGCLGFPAAAAAQTFHPEGVNVRRWAQGEISYLNAETQETTGAESWDLTVHTDGSRTLRARNFLRSPGFLHSVHLRVDADFRPRELLTEYWADGAFRNTTFIAVRGPLLDITARFANTTSHTTVAVPQNFSFVPHPLASDVWHGWYYNKERGGPQPIVTYDLDAGMKPPLQIGQLRDQTLTYLGTEPVNVPAGLFLCDHFRVGDDVDYFVTGPDALFVKFAWRSAKAEYVLSALTRSDGSAP